MSASEAIAVRTPDFIDVPKSKITKPVKDYLVRLIAKGTKVKDIVNLDDNELTITELVAVTLVKNVTGSVKGSNQSIKAVEALKTAIDGREAMEELQEAIRESRVILMGQTHADGSRSEEVMTVRQKVTLTKPEDK